MKPVAPPAPAVTAIVPAPPADLMPAPAGELDFGQVVEMVEMTLSQTSARVYAQTYKAWSRYAAESGINPADLDPRYIQAFLSGQDTTHTTRKRQLTALRRLVRLYAAFSPRHEQYLTILERMKAPAPPRQAVSRERSKRALSPAESDALLRAYTGNSQPAARRNLAIVAVLLLTGLRRAELAALQWRDIDLNRGIVHIRHGKGDKAREAAIMGSAGIDALKAWQQAQGAGYSYVFTRFLKNGLPGKDAPLTTQAIQDIITHAATIAGLDTVRPHDLRRTLITEMLSTGSPVHEAQAQAGHASGDTTLKYAQAASAEQRRVNARLRYGAVRIKS